jgi:serine phosphatase RsbU (regulator of sigma subunit)
MQIAAAKRALGDSRHCGDDFGWWETGGKTVLCMVDGLGHGEHAEFAAKTAIRFVESHVSDPLRDIIAECDRLLHHTRGVVLGLAVVDPAARALTYAGVGNIRAVIVGDRRTYLENAYGIVGGGYKVLRPQLAPFSEGDVAILHTDGLEELKPTQVISGFSKIPPQELADRILREQAVAWDDAAVLVCRCGEVR